MDSLQPGQVGRSAGDGGDHGDRKALSIREFCESLGVSRSTAHKLIRTGKIQSSKVLGKRLIGIAERERLLRGEAK